MMSLWQMRSGPVGPVYSPSGVPGVHRAVQRNEEQHLDEILAKVSAQGIQSLSPDERRFLDEATRRRKTAARV